MRELEGKVAFVTGAASGIGLGIAKALARAGVKVMLCDIEAVALETARAALAAGNADVDAVRADVSLKAELQAAALINSILVKVEQDTSIIENVAVAGSAS